MEQLSNDFFRYGIYCLTICFPIVILERITVTYFVRFIFSLGVNSFSKTIENTSLNVDFDKLKNQKISKVDGYFYFAKNGLIYFRSYNYKDKSTQKIKGIAKIEKGNLKIQCYSPIEYTSMIFLPLIWGFAFIGASYNQDKNPEILLIPLIIGLILFIVSKFGEKDKFNRMCKELEEVLTGKVITDTKKSGKTIS